MKHVTKIQLYLPVRTSLVEEIICLLLPNLLDYAPGTHSESFHSVVKYNCKLPVPFALQRFNIYLMGILSPFSKEDFLSSHVKPPNSQLILLHKNSFPQFPNIFLKPIFYFWIFVVNFSQKYIHLLPYYTFARLWNQHHCRFTSNGSITLIRSSIIFLFDRNSVCLWKFWSNYVLSHVHAWI